MRLLGLDVGSKTVGVAFSDELGWTAQGKEIIKIDEEKSEFGLDRLGEIIDELRATAIVIGFPKHMNNSVGERAEKSKSYGDKVSQRFGLPVDYIDERLTTAQAERFLIDEGNVSRKKRKKVIDKMAAQVILQNYLDANGKLTKL